MTCPYCGKEINPTDIFCEHCDAYVGNTGANTPPKTVPKATTPAPKVAKNPPKKTTIGPSIYTTSTSQQAPAKFSYTDYIIKSICHQYELELLTNNHYRAIIHLRIAHFEGVCHVYQFAS